MQIRESSRETCVSSDTGYGDESIWKRPIEMMRDFAQGIKLYERFDYIDATQRINQVLHESKPLFPIDISCQ